MAEDLPDAPWATGGGSELPDAPWTTTHPQSFGEKLMQTWPVKAAQDLYSYVTAPGDVVTGKANVTPSQPGMWSDEDEARLQATNDAIKNRAVGLASVVTPGSPVPSIAPKIAAPVESALKERAVAGYHNPIVQDVKINAGAAPRLADEIKANFNHPEVGIDENVAPKTHAVLDKLYKLPQATAESDPFLTVNNLRTLKRTLGNVVSNSYGAEGGATERLAANTARHYIDEFLANLSGKDIIQGDPKAASEILKEANANYSAMKTAADLDARIVRAQLRASAANSGMNVGNTIRQRMADILVNPKMQRSFTQDELDRMKTIVEGTVSSNAMRTAGNILGGGGGLASAITGAYTHGIAPVAGFILRSLNNRQTLKAARDISEAVRARSPLGQESIKAVGTERAPIGIPRRVGVVGAHEAVSDIAHTVFPGSGVPVPASDNPDENRRRGGVVKHYKDGGNVENDQQFAHGGHVKQSKASVHYRAGNPNKKCGICQMFVHPNGCTAVAGVVRAGGLCDLFKRKGDL